jgi:TetR/AcrR family transcriptional repressor of nem operon
MQGDLRRPGAKMAEIRGYFDKVIKMADTEIGRRGCMLASTAVEVARRDQKMKKLVRELYDGMTRSFQRALRNSAKAGEINASSPEIRARARYLIGVTQTLSVMLQLGYETKEMKEFVGTALRAVA